MLGPRSFELPRLSMDKGSSSFLMVQQSPASAPQIPRTMLHTASPLGSGAARGTTESTMLTMLQARRCSFEPRSSAGPEAKARHDPSSSAQLGILAHDDPAATQVNSSPALASSVVALQLDAEPIPGPCLNPHRQVPPIEDPPLPQPPTAGAQHSSLGGTNSSLRGTTQQQPQGHNTATSGTQHSSSLGGTNALAHQRLSLIDEDLSVAAGRKLPTHHTPPESQLQNGSPSGAVPGHHDAVDADSVAVPPSVPNNLEPEESQLKVQGRCGCIVM